MTVIQVVDNVLPLLDVLDLIQDILVLDLVTHIILITMAKSAL
jgi:hypothetical protein